MGDVMADYKKLVPFLAKVMGENCEVALQDLSADKQCIVAIANGHVSGREIGAPLTDMALRMVAQEIWKTQDSVANYTGMTEDERQLRSSTYFIKDEQGTKLLGMLCINIDISEYRLLCERILKIGQIPNFQALQPAEIPTDQPQTENFHKNMNEIINTAFLELFPEGNVAPKRLTQSERLRIVEKLDELGLFLLKNSIYSVAKKLGCSEASVYRYLSKVHKEQGEKSDNTLSVSAL